MHGMFETLTLGGAIARDHRAAAVFTRYGLDCCCDGRRTIAEACRIQGINPAALYDELRAASEAPDPGDDIAGWPVARVIDRIIMHHHTYVRNRAPIIAAYLAKSLATPGRSHHELQRIGQWFGELVEDLFLHMEYEEQQVFPGLLRLARAHGPAVAGLAQTIAVAEEDHRRTGAALQTIRVLSDDYTHRQLLVRRGAPAMRHCRTSSATCTSTCTWRTTYSSLRRRALR